MTPSAKIKLIFICIITVVMLILVCNTIGIVKVEGDEAVVKQDLFKGVVDDVWRSGTKFYLGWTTDVYKYDIGTQKVTFDDDGKKDGAEYDSIEVNVGENGGQSAWIPLSINYRIGWEVDEIGNPRFSPAKLVALHKDGLRGSYEDVVIKRTVIEVVNRIARPKQALEIYSGKGYNLFVKEISDALLSHPVFRRRGILVENVIVYTVKLNPAYEAEIENKQLAKQKKLREREETLAAEERAKRIFADSQAEVEKVKQIAEGEKITRIKAAEAEKAEQVLMAEGRRDADLAKASGVLAIGTAEAKVEALKRDAKYAGEAGKRRAQVEISIAQAEKLAGIFEGVSIVPEKTILSIGKSSSLAGLVVDFDKE